MPQHIEKRSSHAPNIEGDNQPGRLYRFLKRHFGKEFTTLALANEIDTVALHSVKNHVDQQLPPGERINVEWRTVNGKRRVYYSLVKMGGSEA